MINSLGHFYFIKLSKNVVRVANEMLVDEVYKLVFS